MKQIDDRSVWFRSIRALVFFALLPFTSACTTPRDATGAQTLSSATALEVMTPGDKARLEALTRRRLSEGRDFEYRIGPDDLVEVQVPDLVDSSMGGVAPAGLPSSSLPVVAQAPVYQQGLRVDADGKITLPFIGAVEAAGRSPAELEREVAQRLRQAGILRNPQVSVRVVEYRSRVAAVVGSVSRPGLYPLTRPGATVGDLIWAAGGPTTEAGRVVEFAPAADASGGEPQPEPMRIDFAALLRSNGLRENSIDPPVRKGDVITVSPAGSVLVDGWVAKPGAYPATRGLTVSGAVAAAGGDLYPADVRHATVARASGSGSQEPIPVDLEAVAQGTQADMPITDGDIVRVPAAPARLVPYGAWTLVLAIFRFGGSVVAY
jgi:protein involved in polysaccharide export with SLBB domain